MNRAALLTWDHREQPDFERLAAILGALTNCAVHVTEPNTGDDQMALVFSTEPLSDKAAAVLYGKHLETGEDAWTVLDGEAATDA